MIHIPSRSYAWNPCMANPSDINIVTQTSPFETFLKTLNPFMRRFSTLFRGVFNMGAAYLFPGYVSQTLNLKQNPLTSVVQLQGTIQLR